MIDFLFGCAHAKSTFPMNQRVRGVTNSPYAYVCCLECGKEFEYDWRTMRVVGAAPEVEPEGLKMVRELAIG